MDTIKIPRTSQKRVVIIGGGFAGLALADKLCGDHFQVVLVDRHNYHQFQPLLYQVASAGLEPSSISFPFRKNFSKKRNFYFRMAVVTRIVSDQNYIETPIGTLSYDYLVIRDRDIEARPQAGILPSKFRNGDAHMVGASLSTKI